MRYTILKSRDLYIVYEGDEIIGSFYTLKKAEDKIKKLEYANLIYLLMTDY